ncbi:MAG: virulence protein RhuM/Fic/DOC family protein [Candidatus Rickettsia vulgarisii]
MKDKVVNNQLVIYQTKDGEIKIDVQLHNETVWLSLNQMSQLFKLDKSVISRHLKKIFVDQELDENSVVAKNATTASDGKTYQVEYYNLDVILSVGYRVNSKVGAEFRKWTSNILKDYLIQGYSINHDRITEDKLEKLKQSIDLLSVTLIKNNLITDTGKEVVELIKAYSKTWDILVKYDGDKLAQPTNLNLINDKLLSYEEAVNAIERLKQDLSQNNDAEIGNLFGLERDRSLKGILGNIDQTFAGKFLYTSVQEKASHLLYFVIKDHPFSDGNKRIGSLLFLLYLTKANIGLKNLGANAMTSLALLIAESSPSQKELMINLIMNLIVN